MSDAQIKTLLLKTELFERAFEVVALLNKNSRECDELEAEFARLSLQIEEVNKHGNTDTKISE